MATIALKTSCGLCNRLRATLSGIGLARSTGRELAVWWPPTWDFNCSGERCFDLQDAAFRFVDGRAWQEYKGEIFAGDARKRIPTAPLDCDMRIYASCSFHHDVTSPLSQWTHLITPKLHLQQQIDAFYEAKLAGHRCVSVMIRLGGFTNSKMRTTKLDWFYKRMCEILAEYGDDVLFFLVCCSKGVSKLFHNAFPRNVVELPNRCYLPRTVRLAYQSVINVYLMAKTSYVLGTYWSSYARQPTILNDKLYLETHMTEPQKIVFD
jgi:hypothetical protein